MRVSLLPEKFTNLNTDHIEPVVTLKVILSQMQVTKTFRSLLGSGITRWHRVQKSEMRNQERASDIMIALINFYRGEQVFLTLLCISILHIHTSTCSNTTERTSPSCPEYSKHPQGQPQIQRTTTIVFLRQYKGDGQTCCLERSCGPD